ncbi:MAG: glycine--tRNA ligase subunit beta [Campylobacterales bacterium]|nr:glycine--tRNA ligase subunit beta [Campylobacterales bacterium]
MLHTLLIEIGVEELPALPLLNELEQIERKWADVLSGASLLCAFEFYYTPRRLVLWHREFPALQPERVEELFGAPVDVAYKNGVATPAAEGFAKKCGVSLDAIGRSVKGGKEVLYYRKVHAGQPSETLLESMIQTWLSSLSFGKSMRWGSLSESFIRPVRWVNVLLGERLVDMQLFGVRSSAQTYVHRMHSFEPLHVSTPQDYFDGIEAGRVTLFPELRRQKILSEFAKLSAREGFEIEIDEALLGEVVAITEQPTALLGSFDEAFLRLPPEAIITSMKEHQRYFPVFKDGVLQNRFVVVSNALCDDFSKVIEGNERVLRPRLSDALFFYENDLKRGLCTQGLEKVVFINGLGTLQDKIAREEQIALGLFARYGAQIAAQNGKSVEENEALLRRSVSLAKADLMSEMVYEFTELQGLMGSYYALALGEAPEVALCIKEQYLPTGEESALPSTLLSALVAMAIKLDTLMGLFSVNQLPTGSRDPFALRRAVNGLVRIILAYRLEFDFVEVIESFKGLYAHDERFISNLRSFIQERLFGFYSVNPSIIEAVLGASDEAALPIERIDRKIRAVHAIVSSDGFAERFSTFKRVANITKDLDMSTLHVNESLLIEAPERALYEAFTVVCAGSFEGYEERLDALFSLKPQLDAFFDGVMVNAEDEALRQNRRALVGGIYQALLYVADIKKISV